MFAVAAKVHHRALRRDGTCGVGPVVATRSQASRLPGRVDASDLHRHRGETRRAQQQHDDQARNAKRRLDRGTADLTT